MRYVVCSLHLIVLRTYVHVLSGPLTKQETSYDVDVPNKFYQQQLFIHSAFFFIANRMAYHLVDFLFFSLDSITNFDSQFLIGFSKFVCLHSFMFCLHVFLNDFCMGFLFVCLSEGCFHHF